jgi:hypothetical protein
LAVLCAHGIALQALHTAPPAAGPALVAGLRVRTIEPAYTPEPAATMAPAGSNGAKGKRTDAAPTATRGDLTVQTKSEAASPAAPVAASTGSGIADPAATVPARIAPPMRLRYEVSGHTRDRAVTGQAELSWQHDGRHYEAHLEVDGEGLVRRRQHSAGQITPGGLAPRRYAERARQEEAVHFERGTGRAVFSANRPPAPLQADTQDRLSLLLQLGARIAARPQAYPAGSYLEIQATTTREALIWRFQVEGTEELRLPAGHQTTLRLVRRPMGEFEPLLEVWLAPGLDYVPVRMRLTQHTGDHLDYRWSGTDRP